MAPPPVVARLLEPQVEVAPAPAPRKVSARKPQPAAPQLPEATTVGQYRYLLAAAAVRYNSPASVEGDVLVRIGVDASGAVSEVSVARSSGHAALDAQALEMFRNAARDVAVPRTLWGRGFEVELKTTYRSG
jgi:TonB family protein